VPHDNEEFKTAINKIQNSNKLDLEEKAQNILGKCEIINLCEIIINDTVKESLMQRKNCFWINTIKNAKLMLHNVVEISELQISTALVYGRKVINDLIYQKYNLINFNYENMNFNKNEEIKQIKNPILILKTISNPNFVALVGMILTCAEERIPFTINGRIVDLAFFVASQFNNNVKEFVINKNQEN
jgi:hypothetical protein